MATSRIADSVGRVLGDRYRLIRPLGVGASAHVYVGEDVNLRRLVAIKVLHPALAGDEAFLRRFRAEAQVVAALRHPNILRVYDWGQDAGAPYLVMELLEGGSLRALLDRGHLLSPAQAAAIGADAAHALDYAHRRGLVHRDIKPANLIFDDEGRLTVADFGLARALAEASWTEPAGAVVGTARYAAPEAVRGESLDSRADVYALALVLIEAMTGVVPFAADTTLATLMGRIDRPVRVPGDIGPLGPVLESAGTVDPAGRLDALGLARALGGVAAHLPPPAPLPLAGPAAAGEAERDSSPTDYPGRPRLFDGALDGDEAVGDRVDGRSGPPTPTAPGVAPPPAGAPRGRRRRWVALVVAAVILLAAATAVALVTTRALVPSHPVPNLVGVAQASAEGQLRPLHLHLTVAARSYDPRVRAGVILSQKPSRGRLKEGGSIAVTVSLGPQPVAVPSVQGLTIADATSVLQRLGLKVGAVSRNSSMTVAAGVVISSTPDHGALLPGQAVAVVVSTGKPTVPIPSFSGANAGSFAAAQAALAAVHLTATEHDEFSDTVPKGQVIGTDPPAGTPAIIGSSVTVNVSKGPNLVPVPNLTGKSVGAASQVLTNLGFQVSGVSGNPIGTVTGTSPSSGTPARFGSPVQIITR